MSIRVSHNLWILEFRFGPLTWLDLCPQESTDFFQNFLTSGTLVSRPLNFLWRVKWSIFFYKKINFILEIQIKAHFVELFILNNFKEATYSLKFHLHSLQHDLDTSFLHFRSIVESRFIASNQFGNRFSPSSDFLCLCIWN